MYETDSEMTNMIEGKPTADSEQMTKLLLNMGMAWLGSIDFDETDTHPPMQLMAGLFLDNSNEQEYSRNQQDLNTNGLPKCWIHMQTSAMFKSDYVLL